MDEQTQPWEKEVVAVAEKCGYSGRRVYRRLNDEIVPVIEIYDENHRPSHMGEKVWEYLKSHSDAEKWLTLWLNACKEAGGDKSIS